MPKSFTEMKEKLHKNAPLSFIKLLRRIIVILITNNNKVYKYTYTYYRKMHKTLKWNKSLSCNIYRGTNMHKNPRSIHHFSSYFSAALLRAIKLTISTNTSHRPRYITYQVARKLCQLRRKIWKSSLRRWIVIAQKVFTVMTKPIGRCWRREGRKQYRVILHLVNTNRRVRKRERERERERERRNRGRWRKSEIATNRKTTTRFATLQTVIPPVQWIRYCFVRLEERIKENGKGRRKGIESGCRENDKRMTEAWKERVG